MPDTYPDLFWGYTLFWLFFFIYLCLLSSGQRELFKLIRRIRLEE